MGGRCAASDPAACCAAGGGVSSSVGPLSSAAPPFEAVRCGCCVAFGLPEPTGALGTLPAVRERERLLLLLLLRTVRTEGDSRPAELAAGTVRSGQAEAEAGRRAPEAIGKDSKPHHTLPCEWNRARHALWSRTALRSIKITKLAQSSKSQS